MTVVLIERHPTGELGQGGDGGEQFAADRGGVAADEWGSDGPVDVIDEPGEGVTARVSRARSGAVQTQSGVAVDAMPAGRSVTCRR
ncbi:hypothetical protein ETD86_23335 [Nonomuraea turkmeniaca]|uniref:Uncharacterized protein n=1 Tax=Nonomuraea turkmeniaca TaxID=103838 RepID=A0A5S4FG89_9ACTN|nr:hypothetical protein [Nonomuraea turkmeniaca]TMR17468.1 hypothetical protein ETD86_23335 [Nonomuraea turkmeniaca]